MNNDLFDKSIFDFIFVYIQVDALSPEYLDFILHIQNIKQLINNRYL